MADSRIPELIADLEDQATACLLASVPHINRPTAVQISKKLARYLTDNWRGQIIYFPKNTGGELDERDQQIWAEFDGRNHQQLAKKYNLATQQIYQIIKRARAADAQARQRSIFDE